MCKGLRDWMEEERLIGVEQGIEQGIKAFVKDKIDDKFSKDRIISKLVISFQLEPKKAEEYYIKYR